MSRNLGLSTIASNGPKSSEQAARGGRSSQLAMYWQQQLMALKPPEESRLDGTSSISAGLDPSRLEVSHACQGYRGADSDEENRRPSRAYRRFQTAGGHAEASLSFCWICKRRFSCSEDLDHHAGHSTRHRTAIRRLAGYAV